MGLTAADAAALERCVARGGVVVFPADTVYGLACDPGDPSAVERLYELKGRPPAKPAAVLFGGLEAALRALPELRPRTRAAIEALAPGPLTFLIANPLARFPLACGPDPATLGLRVPRFEAALAPLRAVARPLLQSSANAAGGADARLLADVPRRIRDGADLALDGGELPGKPSTVIDLRSFEQHGTWDIVRAGALPGAAVRAALAAI